MGTDNPLFQTPLVRRTLFKVTHLRFTVNVVIEKDSQINSSRCIFTVRHYALHGICYRNSVCLSVSPSVCLSVTLVDCVHMVRPTIMISTPQGSPIILVSGDITLISKFEGGHPKRGR